MLKVAAALVVGLGMVACGGYSQDQAKREVDQLTVLYSQNRTKFVVQKQEIEQGDCDRATKLREAIDQKAKDAAMNPADDDTLTMVQMELTQAEKVCLQR